MIFVFLIFLTLYSKFAEAYNQFLSSVAGEVGSGNFTYYTMNYEGTILLELISTTGDCDLYVSQEKTKPGFEPHENCLQSVTCGVDTVIIPKRFRRPVGIGIFGHPSHEISSFILVFYGIEDFQDILHFNPYSEALQSQINKKSKEQMDEEPKKSEKNSFKTILWSFLTDVLVFMVEVIL